MNVTEIESEICPGTTKRTETIDFISYTVGIWSDKRYLGMMITMKNKPNWNMILSPDMADLIRSQILLARYSDTYNHEISLGTASSIDEASYHVKAERNKMAIYLTFRDSVAEYYGLREHQCRFVMQIPFYLCDKIAQALLNAINHHIQQRNIL